MQGAQLLNEIWGMKTGATLATSGMRFPQQSQPISPCTSVERLDFAGEGAAPAWSNDSGGQRRAQGGGLARLCPTALPRPRAACAQSCGSRLSALKNQEEPVAHKTEAKQK